MDLLIVAGAALLLGGLVTGGWIGYLTGRTSMLVPVRRPAYHRWK